MTEPAAFPASAQPRLGVSVAAIGIAQILSWGSLVYAIAVLGSSMRADLGIGKTALFATFTCSLLISGCAAPLAGKLIDRRGGRFVMSIGSCVAALALALASLATDFLTLLASAVLAGVAMAAVLYDAAFAALHQITGTAYRRSVTIVTLYGGFASTLFWPLSQVLLDAWGWRGALLLYAGLQLCVCLPLHCFLIPAKKRPIPGPLAVTPVAGQGKPVNDPRWLSIAFALSAFALSAVSIHMIGLFQFAGMNAAQAVVAASLMGPAQVAGRVAELALARRLQPVAVGAIAIGLLASALLVLLFIDGLPAVAIVFVFLFGLSNGITTIARGTVPSALYGNEHHGALLGRLARPAFMARALAPVLFASAMAFVPGEIAVAGLLVCAVLALVAYSRAVRAAAGHGMMAQ